jgi:integral membrane protein
MYKSFLQHLCEMNSKLNSIKQIRLIGMIEGISYLFLLFVSMPLKYIFKFPQAVIINGWVHGFLFVLLAFSILKTWVVCKWPFKRAFIAGVASLLPFGTFWFDKSLQKEQSLYE